MEKKSLSYPKNESVIAVVVGFFLALAGVGFIVWVCIDAAKRLFEGR